MEKYESKIVKTPFSAEQIFNKLSNLENIKPFLNDERLKNTQLKDIKISDVEVERESISMVVEPLGKVCIQIEEKEPFKTIKFTSVDTVIAFKFWIQIVEKAPLDSYLKLTMHADLPFMIKMMVGSKLKDGIDKMADMFAMINYN